MPNYVDVNNTDSGVKELLDKQNRSGKAIDTDVGNKEDLITEHRDTIVDAINEVAQGTNYRIFSTVDERDAAYSDENPPPEGILAWCIDQELMYQWRIRGEGETAAGEWVVFSSGGGGGESTAARITLLDADTIPKTLSSDQTSLTYRVRLDNVTTGTIVTQYTINGFTNTATVAVSEFGVYDVTISGIKQDGFISITTKFVSSDSSIKSPSSYIALSIYKGNMLSISELGVIKSQPSTYNIRYGSETITYDSLTVEAEGITFSGKVICADDDEIFSVTLTLSQFGSSSATVQRTVNGNQSEFNLNTADFNITQSDLQDTFGSIFGIYTVSVDAITTRGIKCNTAKYSFVLDSSSYPVVLLLHYSEISVRSDVNLDYAILYNGGSKYNNKPYNVSLYIDKDGAPHKLNEASIETVSDALSIAVTRDMMVEAGLEQDKPYSCYLKIDNPETESNRCNLKYVQADSFTYSTESAVFLLDSSRKITRKHWDSYITTYNQHNTSDINKYANNSVVFHGLAASNRSGINSVDVDGGERKEVICFDGQSNYGEIPLNLFKKSDDGNFNTNSGFTFEIRFKAKQQYTGGSVVECLTPDGTGFRITPNAASISLEVEVNNVTAKKSCAFTRLTSDTWHTVSFVLLPKPSSVSQQASYSDYINYMYNGKWIADNMTACLFMYVDGVLSGMAPVTKQFAYDSSVQYTKMIIGASYNYQANQPDNFVNMQISHVRLYNTALNSNDILKNFICDHSSEAKRDYLKQFNGWSDAGKGSFGNDVTLMPELVFYNANLSQLDATIKTEAKSWVYPNVTVELWNRAVDAEKPILKRYGCEVKVQGTSSCDYAVKNYKVTFYGFTYSYLQKTLTTDELSYVDNYNMLPDELVYDWKSSMGIINSGNMVDKSTKRIKRENDSKWNKKDKKVSVNSWLPAATYTLKADYMESSHAHNTGTAKYVNAVMPEVPPMMKNSLYDTAEYDSEGNITAGEQEVVTLQNDTIKINPVDGVRNAIDGFPVVITYVYFAGSDASGNPSDKHTIMKGVYNFNIDKNAEYVFGYDRYNDEERGVQFDDSGAAIAGTGYYNEKYPDDYEDESLRGKYKRKYVDTDGNEQIVRYDCKSYEISGNTVVDDSDQLVQSAAMFYVNILGGGSIGNEARLAVASDIEIRYHPDEDSALYKTTKGEELLRTGATHTESADTDADALKDYEMSFDGPNGEIMHLLMWLWDVAQNDKEGGRHLNADDIKKEFEKHFDVDNLTMYLLIMRVMGMTDNLAKNMMITTWNASDENIVYNYDEAGNRVSINYDKSTFCKWYLQFYDMDTMLGLSNTGENIFDTSIDIKSHKYSEMWCGDSIDTTKTVKVNFPDIEAVGYSGGASKLWELFNNYYGQVLYASDSPQYVKTTYATLRSDRSHLYGDSTRPITLSYEAIMYFLGSQQIDKIGQYYYNLDMKTKYLGASFTDDTVADKYFYMCNGSRRAFIEDWLMDRIRYIDSKYLNVAKEFMCRPAVSERTNLYLTAKAIAPVYIQGQVNDKNGASNGVFNQLVTSNQSNYLRLTDSDGACTVLPQLSAEGTFNLSCLEFLYEIYGFSAFAQTDYSFENLTSLTSFNLSADSSVNELKLGSDKLVTLNVSGDSMLQKLSAPNCPDIYSVDISSSRLSQVPSSFSAATCVNIDKSRISTLDFSEFKQLEAVNQVTLGVTAGYTSYSSLISTLKQYSLIAGTESDDDIAYLDRILQDARKFLYDKTFKDGVSVLVEFDRALNGNTDTLYQLQRLIGGSVSHTTGGITETIKLSTVLKPQYIYGLALIQLTSYRNVDITDIKFNTPYLKAIVINNTSNDKVGVDSIDISCTNLKYLYLNEVGGIEFKANCQNLTQCSLTNCTITGLVDLSNAKNLVTLNCRKSTFISEVVLSDELSNTNTLNELIFTDCTSLKCVRFNSDTEAHENDYIELHNLALTKLDLYNVYQMRGIRGLNITLSSSFGYKEFSFWCNGVIARTLYNDYYSKGIYCPISGTITIESITSLYNMFSGRCNVIFNGTEDHEFGQLNWVNFNLVESIKNTFVACNKIEFSYIQYLLGNVSAHLKFMDRAFACCFGLEFPSTSGTSYANMKGAYYIPTDLFSKCTGVTSADTLFGSCNRDWGNKQAARSNSLVNNIALPRGVFDGFVSLQSASAILGDAEWISLYNENTESGRDSIVEGGYNSSCGYSLYSDSNVLSKGGSLSSLSYIASYYGDLFDKCVNLQSFGVAYNAGRPSGEVILNTPFNVGKSRSQYCYTKCGSITRGVNSMFRTLKNVPWVALFMNSGNIYEATSPGSTVVAAEIDSSIFLNSSGNVRYTDSSVTSLYGMFANSGLKVKLDGLFTTLRGTVYTTGMFYAYTSADLMLKPELFGERVEVTGGVGYELKSYIKVVDAQQMFGKCTKLTGSFRNSQSRYDEDSATWFELVNTSDNNNCFTTQSGYIKNISNMFNGCTSLGGLRYYKLNDDGTDTVETSIGDVPPKFLAGMTNLINCRGLFGGCTKLKFKFNDFLTTTSSGTQYVHMFEGLHNLKYVDSMFSGMTNLTGMIPDYNVIDPTKILSFGSRLSDCKYFYYNVTNRVAGIPASEGNDGVMGVIEEMIREQLDGKNNYGFNDNDYSIDSDGNITLKWNSIMTQPAFTDRFPLTYRYTWEVNGQTSQQFYEYYKNITDDTLNDSLRPAYYFSIATNKEEPVSETNRHTALLNTRGFLSTRESDDDTYAESIEGVTNLFSGCSSIIGGIPHNLFNGMSKITSLAGVFKNCTQLGLSDSSPYNSSECFRTSSANICVNNPELDECKPLGVVYSNDTIYRLTKPPYCYPFGLLDDLTLLTNVNETFRNVRYLGRPYCGLTYAAARSYPEQFNEPITSADNNMYDEVYALPKYFFRFNTNLLNVTYTFAGTDSHTGINNMCGRLYPYMFSTNTALVNLQGCFKSTSIIGSLMINNEEDRSQRKFYIGRQLLNQNNNLEDIRELFYYCANLTWLNHPNASDGGEAMIGGTFLTTSKLRKLKTLNLINSTYSSGMFGAALLRNTLDLSRHAGKLVYNEGELWANVKQCKDAFSDAGIENSLAAAYNVPTD